jgi:hypothetical protein
VDWVRPAHAKDEWRALVTTIMKLHIHKNFNFTCRFVWYETWSHPTGRTHIEDSKDRVAFVLNKVPRHEDISLCQIKHHNMRMYGERG